MSLCWKCPLIPQTSHFDVKVEWKKAKQQIEDSKCPQIQFVNTFIYRTKEAIASYALDTLQICKEIFAKVCKTKDCLEKSQRNRLLLLGVVDIMAYQGVDNRSLVREILTLLFQYSGCIDREVFMFEHADFIDLKRLPESERETLKRKQSYILQNICGWKLPLESPWIDYTTIRYYIELPFRRPNSDAKSHLMAEALYRQNDPELVLMLLRHGIHPSCLYLWPICILIDLKQTTSRLTLTTENIQQLCEAKIVRYFCRVRHYIRVQTVATEDRHASIASLPIDISYDDVLLLPPKTEYLVPEDRQSVPSKLRHQCRLAIRMSLLEADYLPLGIKSLPLPVYLKEYIDLAYD